MKTVSSISYFFISLVLMNMHCKGTNDVRHSLIALLELQMDYCSDLSLCTIKSQNNASLKQRPTTCCKTCSCDIDCKEMGNCCPDFQLADLIGHNVSNSISDLSERLQNLNSTYQQRLQQLGDASLGVSHAALENLDCVKTEIGKTHFHLKRTNFPHSYRMVTRCPTVSKGDIDTERKCTDDVALQPFKRNILWPDLVVPVTSLKTNSTYKNIYCFRCNEGIEVQTELSFWKVIFTCSVIYYLTEYDNPYILFQRITSSERIYACNLLYQPRETTEHLVSKCSAVDVKTCPDNRMKEVLDICRAYYLPVIYVNRYTQTSEVYRNIACYLCNIKRTFRADCADIRTNETEYSMEMNFLWNDQKTLLRYNFSEQHVLNVSFGNEDGDDCKRGFIQNRKLDSCRQVLCPRYFYPYDGSCIAAFTQMRHVSFTVILEVIRFQKLGKTDTDIFYQVYLDIVAQLTAELSGQFTYGLWKLTDESDILVLSFTAKKSTYIKMIYTLSQFLTQVTVLNVRTGTTTTETLTTLFKGSTPPSLLSGKLLTRFQPRKGRVQLPEVRAYRAFSESPKDIKISRSHLCYRAELSPSENYMDASGTYYINNNSTLLNDDDVQVLPDGRIIVCLDDLYENLTDVQVSYMFGGKSASARAQIINSKETLIPTTIILADQNGTNAGSSTVHETLVGLPKELVITVTFVFVVGAICLVKFIKYQRESSSRRET